MNFQSWVGDSDADTSWLCGKLGDLYLHETVVSHIRRLLATKFRRTALSESPAQFCNRMAKVEEYMNEEMCSKTGEGDSLVRLGKRLHTRCDQLIKLKGERIPKWSSSHNRYCFRPTMFLTKDHKTMFLTNYNKVHVGEYQWPNDVVDRPHMACITPWRSGLWSSQWPPQALVGWLYRQSNGEARRRN